MAQQKGGNATNGINGSDDFEMSDEEIRLAEENDTDFFDSFDIGKLSPDAVFASFYGDDEDDDEDDDFDDDLDFGDGLGANPFATLRALMDASGQGPIDPDADLR
ncbi:hypothetical protein [Bifidobacterium samirii]|uniref:Uncharacterized protein n=1 Tax=Bifidobacterium samirii TaxID=2306974 RepID=A0A430FPB0_9BIFI|nr:hypothetical protein [Bifidobacterium samirii]RSX54670.1 hypothetical protein D2E24_1440 [Bifidobacterium samirii]